MTAERVSLLVVVASCSLAPVVEAAVCGGYAVALTGESRSFCSAAQPTSVLDWSFKVNCYDDCGNQWTTINTPGARATGECVSIGFPGQETTCHPEFQQYNHTSGLWGTSNAFNREVFAGCRDTNLVSTEAACPCAPACQPPVDESPPPSGGGDQEGGSGELPGSGPPDNSTPVILSLDDGRYELTSAAAGVAFDLDADGDAERVAWTVAGSDDAFLALDRNGNGRVDDGRELFGDESPQLPSAEPNGFRALAVFDDPLNGGNGDGWIDRRDAVFDHLRLWRDADHDGVTDDGELLGLAAGGVEALAVDYRTVQRRDVHGNVYRYRAEAIRSVGPGARVAWDVLLTAAAP